MLRIELKSACLLALFCCVVLAQPFPSIGFCAKFENPVRIEVQGWTGNITKGQIIRLGDVAKLTGGSDELRKSMSGLDLEKISDPLAPVKVTADQVKFRLLVAGYSNSQFVVSGSAETKINTEVAAHQKQRIERLLSRELARQLQLDESTFELTLSLVSYQRLLESNVDFEACDINVDFGIEVPIGSRSLNLELSDTKGANFSDTVQVKIQVIRELVRATRNISRGELLDESNVQRISMPVADKSVQLASYEQAIGKTAAVDIQQFATLKPQNIKQPFQGTNQKSPAVKRNTMVRAIFRHGRLEISMDAKAMSSGSIGEVIDILNPVSGQKTHAVVINPTTVEIRGAAMTRR